MNKYEIWLIESYGLGPRPRFANRKVSLECLAASGRQPQLADALRLAWLDSDEACDEFAEALDLVWERDSGGGRYVVSGDNLPFQNQCEAFKDENRDELDFRGVTDEDYLDWKYAGRLLTDEDELVDPRELVTSSYEEEPEFFSLYGDGGPDDRPSWEKRHCPDGTPEQPECPECRSALDDAGGCKGHWTDPWSCAYFTKQPPGRPWARHQRVRRPCRICKEEPGRLPDGRCDNCRDYFRRRKRERSELLLRRAMREPSEPRWGTASGVVASVRSRWPRWARVP